jgi:hypothetical protein
VGQAQQVVAALLVVQPHAGDVNAIADDRRTPVRSWHASIVPGGAEGAGVARQRNEATRVNLVRDDRSARA